MPPVVPVFSNTEIELPPPFATTRSGLPSALKSPMAIPLGLEPVPKSTFAASELVVKLPLVLRLRKTETVLANSLVTAMSRFPSPSRSPLASLAGTFPVVKSTFAANELRVIVPPVPVFRKTDRALLVRLRVARSDLPSPSRSTATRSYRLPEPALKSTLGANDEASMLPLDENVTTNGFIEYAVNPFTVTVIGALVAPVGIVTVREVEVVAVTVALTAPK